MGPTFRTPVDTLPGEISTINHAHGCKPRSSKRMAEQAEKGKDPRLDMGGCCGMGPGCLSL